MLALVTAGLLLAGCGSDASRAAAPAPASPSPSASPEPPPPPPPPPPTDPFTGVPGVPPGAVIALKIDNSPLARPYHRGLGEASILYQEVVEGGASRFLAIYAPATAAEVGPIRSVREGDIEILRQYGRIAIGSSGANAGVLATVAKAAEEGLLLDATYDVAKPAYRRAEKRKDAQNFFTTPQQVDQIRPGGAPPQDIGLRFGEVPPGSPPAGQATVRLSEITQVVAVFDVAAGRYTVYQDGDPMKGYAPANVVVQSVKVRGSAYVDVLGNPTPFTETIGSGAVTVLRDGVQLAGTWERPAVGAGTRFVDAAGGDLPLEVGPTLILLVPTGEPFSIS